MKHNPCNFQLLVQKTQYYEYLTHGSGPTGQPIYLTHRPNPTHVSIFGPMYIPSSSTIKPTVNASQVKFGCNLLMGSLLEVSATVSNK